jgi:hypothetical protein
MGNGMALAQVTFCSPTASTRPRYRPFPERVTFTKIPCLIDEKNHA